MRRRCDFEYQLNLGGVSQRRDHLGGLLNPAVAPEHHLPAVVGTGCATSTFVNGEEAIVDGSAGTVTRLTALAS